MLSNQQKQDEAIQLASSLVESLLDLATENNRRYADFFASQQSFVAEAAKEQFDMLPEVMKLQSPEDWIEWQAERFAPTLSTSFAKFDKEIGQLQSHQRDMFARLCDYWATSSQSTLQLMQQQYPLSMPALTVPDIHAEMGFSSLMKTLGLMSSVVEAAPSDKTESRRNTRSARKTETTNS